MPSIAEVFMRIHVDSSSVKRDTEAGLDRVDTKTAGSRAGRDFGNLFSKEAGNRFTSLFKNNSGNGGINWTNLGRTAGTAAVTGMGSALSSAGSALPAVGAIGPWGAVGIFAALVAAAPFAGQVLAGGIVFGLGAGLAGIGIYAASKAKPVQDAFAAMKDNINKSLTKIGAPMVPVLKSIISTASGVVTALTPVFAAAESVIAGPLKLFADTILNSFKDPAVKSSIKDVSKSFGAILKALAPAIPGIIDGIARGISAIAGAISKNPGAFVGFIKFLGEIVVFALNAIAWLTNVATYIEQHFKPAMHRIAVIFDGVRHDIAHIWDQIWNNTIGSVIRIAHNVETQFNSMRHGVAVTFDGMRHDTAVAWNDLYGATIGVAIRLGHNVETQFDSLRHRTFTIFGDIGNFFGGWWGGTKKLASDSVTWVHDKVASIWDAISKNTKRLWHDIGGWMSAGIKDGLHGLANAINFVTQSLLNPLVSGYNTINNIWSGTDIKPIPKVNFAAGGKITSGTHETADDVLIRVSRNETVLSAAHSRILEEAGILGAVGVPGFATGGQILSDAVRFKGHRYVWGGASNPQTGWDCSSFAGYILGHDFGYPLPGGVRWNPAQHGPVASQFNREPGFRLASHNTKDIQPGDLLVENSGGHVGFGVGPNRMFSAYGTAFGTIFSNADNMTNIYRSTGGVGVYNGPGALISQAQQKQFNNYLKLLDKDIHLYSPQAIARAVQLHPGPLPTVLTAAGRSVYQGTTGRSAGFIKPAVNAKYQAALAAAAAAGNAGQFGGNPGVGSSAGEMANGRQLYAYLLHNLFGGNRIAAAGAIASIWGESTWNPFAQGTGGRGLIGWTPPGSISEANFRGGMRTQLPAILRFVTSSGDSGVIAQMFQASSVLQAANEWGRGVERFGINDVHPQGLALAKQIAGLAKGGRVKGYANGGMITEPMIGIGASGDMIALAENGPERVIPGGGDPQLRKLDRIIALLERAPGATAGGFAKALNGQRGMESQLATRGAR